MLETLEGEARQIVDRLIAAKRELPGALLPLLHDIQEALGYVPAGAVPLLATALNRSRAEVHGVLTFYHHFRQEKPGKHVLRLCRAEACQANGAEALLAHARRSLACGDHESTADGAFTLEPVYCLGQCACGPALLVDDEEIHARMTPEKFDALLASKRSAS
jgi:formate dehydrogenase subunit gamma